MNDAETSRSDELLTDDQKGSDESSEPAEDRVESADNKVIAGFQKSLQEAREREKQANEELVKYRKQVQELKNKEKQEQLAQMSEAEKWRVTAEEETKKRAEVELQLIVTQALEGKKVPTQLAKILRKTPWAIPEVQEELGDDYTWDDVITSVKRHLPAYLDSFNVQQSQETDNVEPSVQVDSERATDLSVSRQHVYTRAEVARLSQDPQQWDKHKDAVFKQMRENNGALPE